MTLVQTAADHDALQELLRAKGVGELAGVTFDFRHPALDPKVLCLTDALECLPIWFPWTGEEWRADDAALEDEIGHLFESGKRLWENLELLPGDTLSTSRVTSLGGARTPLERQTDHESRFAYFVVTRRDGTKIEFSNPLSFHAIDAIQAHSIYMITPDDDQDLMDHLEPFAITFEKIAARIDRLDDE